MRLAVLSGPPEISGGGEAVRGGASIDGTSPWAYRPRVIRGAFVQDDRTNTPGEEARKTVFERFLSAYWADAEAGSGRDGTDHLNAFPGDAKTIATECLTRAAAGAASLEYTRGIHRRGELRRTLGTFGFAIGGSVDSRREFMVASIHDSLGDGGGRVDSRWGSMVASMSDFVAVDRYIRCGGILVQLKGTTKPFDRFRRSAGRLR